MSIPEETVKKDGDGQAENTQPGPNVTDEPKNVFVVAGNTIHRRRIQ